MGIEKMTFVDIKGSADDLDEVLIRCAQSGIIQVENAARLSDYSIGAPSMLRNPYAGLLTRFSETAAQLGVALEYRKFDQSEPVHDRAALISQAEVALDRIQEQYRAHIRRQEELREQIDTYGQVQDLIHRIQMPKVDFELLWQKRYLKIRFGSIPADSLARLEAMDPLPCEVYPLDSEPGQIWILYATTSARAAQVDSAFEALDFHRLHLADYVHGTGQSIESYLIKSLNQKRKELQAESGKSDSYVQGHRELLLQQYSRFQFLHDACELRRYAVIIRGQFHVVGYVLTRQRDQFLQLFDSLPTVKIEAEKADYDAPIPAPVQLRNNWFVRPFEMFVNMYGSPSYRDIDPTPFVAYTYSLLFGMMFGDLGHGFAVMLLGIILWLKSRMPLGPIMARIGAVSMFFGFWYGSVFGFEHLLDPVFRRMGFAEKPIHVMNPATTNLILVAAIAIGAAILVMVILFNIIIGIHQRDFVRSVLSHNGLAGLVFYGGALTAAVATLLGYDLLSTPYIIGCFVVPLLLIFFKEPIARYLKYRDKDVIIHSDRSLEQSIRFREGSVNFPELFTTKFVAVRFGRIPTDSYRKLHFYEDAPFMIYPIKADREYIWCIYAMASLNKGEIDAIFHDLYFERVYIPKEEMETAARAEAFIKRCIEGGRRRQETLTQEKYGTVTLSRPKTIYQTLFPEGFGGFLIETFFELFEICLSFITNTMSFLRVGGFILVHAGMMEVVFKLSEMVGGGASPVIIIVGNLFVMAMEGLIVGIQVLRLEFYEIFGRFFDADGDAFRPFQVRYGAETTG